MGGTVEVSVTYLQLPVPHYETIYLPDGTHSGVRFDRFRGILEIQKKGVKHFVDLATLQPITFEIKGV